MNEDIKRILILKLGALGDVVRTSFFLPGISRKYINAKISWLTEKNAADLLRFNPFVDKIYTVDDSAELVYQYFDLVFSCDEDSKAMKALSEIKHTELIGAYQDESGVVTYTRNSSGWFDMSLISMYGKASADKLKKENQKSHSQIWSEILEIEVGKPPFIYNSTVLERRMSIRFNCQYFNVGLNSAAGKRWPSKSLSVHETVSLINLLLSKPVNSKPVRIVLLGGPEERERHKFLMERFPTGTVVDSGNDNDLLVFSAIIKNCDYIVTSDSLALHLAIGQAKMSLSFYAPTSAAEIECFNLGVKVVSSKDDYCSYKKEVDTSDITAVRIYSTLIEHIQRHIS
jgi:heptosyltransferase-2